jgi:hypothetical protein
MIAWMVLDGLGWSGRFWTVWTVFVSGREDKSKTYKAFWQTNRKPPETKQKPKALYCSLGMTPDIQKNCPDCPDRPGTNTD